MIVLYCVIGYLVAGIIAASLFVKFKSKEFLFEVDDFWFWVAFWWVLVLMWLAAACVVIPLNKLTHAWVEYLRK